MGRHERDSMHQDPELTGAHRQRVEVELADGGVGAKEVVAAQGAARDHQGATGQDEEGLGHAQQGEQESGHVAPM